MSRFFSTAGSTARRSDDGAVYTPQFVVDGAGVHVRGAKSIQDLVQQAARVPVVEVIVSGLPRSELLRHIAPGRTSS
jgi:hypothetical protein